MISRKPKKRRIPNPLKVSTRSAVTKGPARDKAHLAKVREFGCVICRKGAEAHHVRLGLRTMGKRKSDYLAMPLCPAHHAKLHSMNEADFWIVCNIRPRQWIAAFSPAGAAAIDAIEAQRKRTAP